MNQPTVNERTEDRLRAEIEDLKRQLEEHKALPRARQLESAPLHRQPGADRAVAGVLIVVGFFVGYLPRQRREAVLAAETKESRRRLSRWSTSAA